MHCAHRPPIARLLLVLLLGTLSPFTVAQILVNPVAPQRHEAVWLQIPRAGALVFDPSSVDISMDNEKITVGVKYGAALSPPPPPSTFQVELGQFPQGDYVVEAVLQGPQPVSLGVARFTVGPPVFSPPRYTDLWWDPDESGWGLNVVDHGKTSPFLTLFAYDANGAPTWYVMPTGLGSGDGLKGTLYRTTGPQVLDTFDPGQVTRTPVGTLAADFIKGVLKVTIDGQTITKPITRQPF